MIGKDDKVLKERIFTFENEKYIARLYKREGKASIYGEIVFASNGKRVPNMKGLAREFLKPYGIIIPTDVTAVITHTAVKILIEKLDNIR